MPQQPDPVAARLRAIPGIAALVAEAEDTWRARAAEAYQADEAGEAGRSVTDDGEIAGRPGWRTFEDAFPTFYEFTNRPR